MNIYSKISSLLFTLTLLVVSLTGSSQTAKMNVHGVTAGVHGNAKLNVHGDMEVESRGKVENRNEIRVSKDISSNSKKNGSFGRTFVFGPDVHKLKGTEPPRFSILSFDGTGDGLMSTNVVINDSLLLSDRQLMARSNQVLIDDPEVGSISYSQSGGISTQAGGEVKWRMEDNGEYVIPFVGPNGTRPVSFSPQKKQAIIASLVKNDPQNNGYSRDSLYHQDLGVNDRYYYELSREHLESSTLVTDDDVEVKLPFSPAIDQFEEVVIWDEEEWRPLCTKDKITEGGFEKLVLQMDHDHFPSEVKRVVSLGKFPYEDLSGTYKVGGPDGDFADMNEVEDLLKGSRLQSPGVMFRFRDGQYSSLDIGPLVKGGSNLVFMGDGLDTSEVEIGGGTPVRLNCVRADTVGFVALDVQGSGGGDGMSISDLGVVILKSLNIQGSGENGIRASKVDSLDSEMVRVSGFDNALNGQKIGNVRLESNDLSASEKGVSLSGIEQVRSLSNNISASSQAVVLENCDEIIEKGDSISGTGGGMRIDGFVSVDLSRNHYDVDPSGGSYLVDIAQPLPSSNLHLGENQFYGSGNGILLQQVRNNLWEILSIRGNMIEVEGKGLKLEGIRNERSVILHNRIKGEHGVDVSGIKNGEGGPNFRITGNLVESSIVGIGLHSSRSPLEIDHNTVVLKSSSEHEQQGVFIGEGVEELTLCGNLATVEYGEQVVYFQGIPSLTTYFNNWYSENASTVSNNESLALGATDSKLKPYFRQDSYQLSYQSDLIDEPIPCSDSLSLFDLNGQPRTSGHSDAGAIESPTTKWDGLKVQIELKEGAYFEPEGQGNYSNFQINGLENYNNVVWKVKNQRDEIVFQTTQKDGTWDGRHYQGDVLVPQGTYRYFLTLDGEEIQGLVYVKRSL